MKTALMIHPDRTVTGLEAERITGELIDQRIDGAAIPYHGPGWTLWYDPNNTPDFVDPATTPENLVARQMLQAQGFTPEDPIRGRIILTTAPLDD